MWYTDNLTKVPVFLKHVRCKCYNMVLEIIAMHRPKPIWCLTGNASHKTYIRWNRALPATRLYYIVLDGLKFKHSLWVWWKPELKRSMLASQLRQLKLPYMTVTQIYATLIAGSTLILDVASVLLGKLENPESGIRNLNY